MGLTFRQTPDAVISCERIRYAGTHEPRPYARNALMAAPSISIGRLASPDEGQRRAHRCEPSVATATASRGGSGTVNLTNSANNKPGMAAATNAYRHPHVSLTVPPSGCPTSTAMLQANA